MPANQFPGPRAKLRAARRHGDEFQKEIRRYRETLQGAIRCEVQPPSTERVVWVEFDPSPEDLSAIIGDMVHQLRSALDVLACDLARWSGAEGVNDVYFPIAKTEAFYKDQASKKTKKLKPELRRMIDQLKPYGPDSVLYALNQLANIDKHRALIEVMASVADTEWSVFGRGEPERVELGFRKPAPLASGRLELLRIPATSPIDGVHVKLTCRVIFVVEPLIGEPASEMLTQMARTVDGIVQSFERHCLGGGN